MLIPSSDAVMLNRSSSLSRRVNANSQLRQRVTATATKLIKKGEC